MSRKFLKFIILLNFFIYEIHAKENLPYVILISLDGFRHDYIDKYSPPNLLKLRESGSFAEALVPVYPSITFTNHYSIITGLYPENHGILANHFYDPDRKEVYSMRNEAAVVNGDWYGGVPLWSLAEKNKLKSACYFWPGSEAEIAGYRPSYFKKYKNDTPSQERVDAIIQWLKFPEEERPHFLTLYFSLVDTAGHEYGAESDQVKDAVLAVDDAIGKLVNQLKEIPLPVNILIVSDHGMTNADKDKSVILSEFIDSEKVIYSESGTHVSIFLKKSEDQSFVYNELKKKLPKSIRVYLRSNIPNAWHVKKNKRVGDILVMADPPYTVHMNKRERLNIGFHGYLPNNSDMHGIFLAIGPNIRAKKKIKKMESIHIYPLIARVLSMRVPKKIDGKESVLKSWIKK